MTKGAKTPTPQVSSGGIRWAGRPEEIASELAELGEVGAAGEAGGRGGGAGAGARKALNVTVGRGGTMTLISVSCSSLA